MNHMSALFLYISSFSQNHLFFIVMIMVTSSFLCHTSVVQNSVTVIMFLCLNIYLFYLDNILVRQPSPLFCSNPDLEYIVFSLQNIVVQTPHLKNPEGVQVSPLGNFSYSRFSKWPPIASVEMYLFHFQP